MAASRVRQTVVVVATNSAAQLTMRQTISGPGNEKETQYAGDWCMRASRLRQSCLFVFVGDVPAAKNVVVHRCIANRDQG